MLRRMVPGLAMLACLWAAPGLAQDRAASPSQPAETRFVSGPRLPAPYGTFQPAVAQPRAALTAAASSSTTTITISTVALVAIAVVLLILLL